MGDEQMQEKNPDQLQSQISDIERQKSQDELKIIIPMVNLDEKEKGLKANQQNSAQILGTDGKKILQEMNWMKKLLGFLCFTVVSFAIYGKFMNDENKELKEEVKKINDNDRVQQKINEALDPRLKLLKYELLNNNNEMIEKEKEKMDEDMQNRTSVLFEENLNKNNQSISEQIKLEQEKVIEEMEKLNNENAEKLKEIQEKFEERFSEKITQIEQKNVCPEGLVNSMGVCHQSETKYPKQLNWFEAQESCQEDNLRLCTADEIVTGLITKKLKNYSFALENVWYLSSSQAETSPGDTGHGQICVVQGNYDEPNHPEYSVQCQIYKQSKGEWSTVVCCR